LWDVKPETQDGIKVYLKPVISHIIHAADPMALDVIQCIGKNLIRTSTISLNRTY